MMQSCLIIGAGLSGLTAARELQQRGVRVQIVDKGRGVGGRMATRRLQDNGQTAVFDHGAQFFTARSDEFKTVVANWQNAQVSREWYRGQTKVLWDGQIESSADGHPRFAGATGMTAPIKAQSEGLKVLCNQRIVQLGYDEANWHAVAEDGQEFVADSLLLTPPVPQSLALLDSGDFRLPDAMRAELEAMQYESCIALMLWLHGPGQVPSPGALSLEGEPISWIADNYQKGISSAAGAITIHAAPTWSREHWQDADEEVVKVLCATATRFLGSEIRDFSIARWKYSKPISPRDSGCVALPSAGLVFAGDAFAGAKVEGAFSSGLAAARAVLGFE